MTRQNWHWDINLSESKIKKILTREDDPRFPRIAGALLSRVEDPKAVFKLISPRAFCRRWRAIEHEIQSDEWTKEKAAFWKTTYLRLSRELRENGQKIRQTGPIRLDDFDKNLVAKIRECRKKAFMTQSELAGFMKCSQQFISNLEKGREKANLEFLKKLARTTRQSIELVFEPQTQDGSASED